MSTIGPRWRQNNKEFPVELRSTDDGVSAAPTVFTRWTRSDGMADFINPKTVNGHRAPGPCNHLTLSKTYVAPSFHSWRQFSHPRHDSITYNPDFLSSFGNDLGGLSAGGSKTDPLDYGYMRIMDGGTDFLSTPRFSDLCFDAWTKLKTQVPTDVEILNFVYEFKDFKDIFKHLFHPKTGLEEFKEYAGTSNWKKVRSLPKQINGQYLNTSFNWLPLISDITKLFSLHDNAARRLDYLRKTKGKEVTVRFIKTDCYDNHLLNSEQLLGFQNSDWVRPNTLTKYNCDFHVTAKLYQDLEGLDDAYAQMRADIAALGINNPLKAIWNAVPFSFVVDWVAPFGKWLERGAIQPFYGVWKVYDITTSVRERGEVEVRVRPNEGRDYQFDPILVSRVEIDRYVRLVGLPQTLGAIDFSQLTSTQQKLFLSLVLTKVL